MTEDELQEAIVAESLGDPIPSPKVNGRTYFPIASVPKSTPVMEADPNWMSRLILNSQNHKPKALLANAIIALQCAPEWASALGWDEFSAKITVQKPLPWPVPVNSTWSDQCDRKCTVWLQHHGIYVPTRIAGEAAQTVAMDNSYHPCRDYLRALKWDGIKRVDSWLQTYIGVECVTEPNEPNDGSAKRSYVSGVGRRFLISAVARIFRPGTKVDTVLVLESPKQGTYKSMACETLFNPWFCDHLPDLSSKDAYLQLSGVWCVELAELDAISRADSSRVKSFLSSPSDRYRLPYGHRAIDVPRSSVFMGTVNHDEWQRDETGGRRWWPVRCGWIDIDGLRFNRDQLWAEALALYDAKEQWWVDNDELTKLTENEQFARYDGDVWDSMIAEWTRSRDDISVSEVLGDCIKKSPELWSQHDKNRVARSLRARNQWERYQKRIDSGNGREWRYKRKLE